MSATEEQRCTSHPEVAAAGTCNYCAKAICRDCIKRLGYYCSPACLKSSRAAISSEEKHAAAANRAMMEKTAKAGKALAGVVALLLVIGIGWFVWSWFLTPVGRISWEVPQDGDVQQVRIIAQHDNRVYLQTPAGIKILDAASGETLGLMANPDMATLRRLVVTDDGFIGIAPGKIIRLNTDGKTTATIELTGWNQEVVLSADHRHAFYVAGQAVQAEDDDDDEGDEEDAAPRRRPAAQMHLVGIDLAKGREMWRKALAAGTTVGKLTVGDRCVVAVYTSYDPASRASRHLMVGYERGSGKRLWGRPLTQATYTAPIVHAGIVLVDDGSKLIGVSEAGEVKWELGYRVEERIDYFQQTGLLFVQQAGGSLCYDFASGKPMWRTNLEFGQEDVFIIGDRVFVHGEITRSKDIAIGDMPGFNQDQEVVEEFGLNKASIDQSVSILMALDRATGSLKWQEERVSGQLLCDGERLVLFMDTAETSMLSMLKTSADTVVRQFNPATGSRYVDRTFERIGLASPVLVGNRLIGIKYDQEEAIAKGRLTISEAASGVRPKPASCQSIMAIRLK